MKIRVRDYNKQNYEIHFEAITSILGMIVSGIEDDSLVQLEFQVNTVDRKELIVLADDVPLLLFLYFHDGKEMDIHTGDKVLEFEEVINGYEEIYLGYIRNMQRGVPTYL